MKIKQFFTLWLCKPASISVQNRICETHFKHEDFEQDLKNELLGLPIVKRLLKTAIPSLKISGEKRKSETLASRQIRYEKREKKDRMELIDSFLKTLKLNLPKILKSFLKTIWTIFQLEQNVKYIIYQLPTNSWLLIWWIVLHCWLCCKKIYGSISWSWQKIKWNWIILEII